MQGREAANIWLKGNIASGPQSAPKRLVFLFDTNVLISYCAPWLAGASGERGRTIFPGQWATGPDSEKVRERLGDRHTTLTLKALAEFAMINAPDAGRQWQEQGLDEELAPIRQPTLMFGAHYDESKDIYRGVAAKAQQIVRSLGHEDVIRREAQLATNVMVLLRSEHVAEDAPPSVRALNLVDFLISRQMGRRLRGAAREWDRYVRLSLSTGGVYPASQAKDLLGDHDNLSHAFSVFNGDLSEGELGLREDLVSYWRRMVERQKGRPNDPRLATDAEALADLFLVNKRLQEKGDEARVVLVTGDENLVKATYGGVTLSRASIREPDLRDYLVSQSSPMATDFSLRYVRHLWAYIEDALIGRDALKDSHVADFFNGLLAKGAERTSFSAELTERIALFPKEHQDLIPSLERINVALSDWIDLSTSGTFQSGLNDFAINDEFRQTILDIVLKSDAKLEWSAMLRLIQEQIDQEQDRLTTNLSDTGIAPLVKAGLLGARNPPDLNFASFPITQSIFTKLAHGAYGDAKDFERDFASIKDDCVLPVDRGQIDDRQLSYLKYVVLGAAFASADKWSVALEHAAMARAILDRREAPIPPIPHGREGEKSTKVITGREALFLSATAQRIVAETDADLETARTYLVRAERALGSNPETNPTERFAHKVRFDGERLALGLARYYLERSLTNFQCDDLYDAALTHARVVAKLPMSEHWQGPARDIARVSIAINLVQISAISTFRTFEGWGRPDDAIDIVRHVPEYLQVVKSLVRLPEGLRGPGGSESTGTLTCSNLMTAYYIAGALIARSSGGEVSKQVSTEQLMASFPSMQTSVVTKYDPWRYQRLLEFCNRISLPPYAGNAD
ncbi:MAG: hypothetical protein JWR51_443 [Devosia sp.]|nr:hypothetical protein [Devosia sp.]